MELRGFLFAPPQAGRCFFMHSLTMDLALLLPQLFEVRFFQKLFKLTR